MARLESPSWERGSVATPVVTTLAKTAARSASPEGVGGFLFLALWPRGDLLRTALPGGPGPGSELEESSEEPPEEDPSPAASASASSDVGRREYSTVKTEQCAAYSKGVSLCQSL